MTRTVRVGDVMDLVRDPVQIDPSGIYRPVGIKSFGNGLITYPPCSGAELSKLRYFAFPPNALALSNIKAWEGAVAVTCDDCDAYVASNRFLFYLPGSPDEVDVRYLYYYFTSERGLYDLGQASPGSADRNRTLSIKSFERLAISLPNIDEQRRIMAKLDAATGAAGRVEAARPNAVSTARATLSAALAATEGTARIGDVASRVRRVTTVTPAQTYRLAGVKWYGNGVFVRETKAGSDVAVNQLSELREGDFVYNRLFGWKGAFASVGSEHDGLSCSGEFPIYRGQPDHLRTEYLALACGDPNFWNRAKDNSKGATATSRNRLKEVDFEELSIPLPSLPEQDRLVRLDRLVRRYEQLETCREGLLKALRPSLLNAAFSGRL